MSVRFRFTLSDRRGTCVGFFYLRTKDASRYERKVSVFVKGADRHFTFRDRRWRVRT